VKTWLIDTGPLVAYLDSRDPAHSEVVERFDQFSGSLATTSAVITEAMHFVSAAPTGPRLLAELVSASAIEVYDLCRSPELDAAVALMEKYSDTPMDFADATLVLLAEALGLHDILTLDRRGFSAYRTRPGRAFRRVLDRPDPARRRR
jgi:predicted nucleic acid-binding protein